jgi:hypothetical protein
MSDPAKRGVPPQSWEEENPWYVEYNEDNGADARANQNASLGREQARAEALAADVPTEEELRQNYVSYEGSYGEVLPEHLVQNAYAADAQKRMFDQYQDIYAGGGFTGADRAAMRLGINEVNQSTKARQDAMMQQMAARGMGGSGLEFQAAMANEQGGANRMSDLNAQMQIQGQDRMMKALEGAGLASQRGFDMDKWNAEYMQAVYGDNLDEARKVGWDKRTVHNSQEDANRAAAIDGWEMKGKANALLDEKEANFRIFHGTRRDEKNRADELQSRQTWQVGQQLVGQAQGIGDDDDDEGN